MTDEISRQYRPPVDPDDVPYTERGPLTDREIDLLARYLERQKEGVAHTPEWDRRMADLRNRWERFHMPLPQTKRRRLW